MSELEQRLIFCNNLKRIMSERGLSQTEVAEAIAVSPQTFNTWMTGKAIPRMNKLQALADYFNVAKSALIEETNEPIMSARDKLLQEAFDNPDRRILFSLNEKATDQQIKAAIQFMKALLGEDE